MNFKITTLALASLIVAVLLLAPELFEQPVRTSTTSAEIASTTVPTKIIESPNRTDEPLPKAATTSAQKNVEVLVATTTLPSPSNITLSVEGATYRSFIPQETTVLEVMQTLASTSGLVFTGREYTSLGFFVETLNGKKAADGYVWILYVNGKKSGEGVSTMRVSPNDTIEWKYEKSY